MKVRIFKEFSNFISEVKSRYPRQKLEEEFLRRSKPLLSLDLKKYSKTVCLREAAGFEPKHNEWIGRIAYVLFSRSGKGKTTMKKAKELWTLKGGD